MKTNNTAQIKNKDAFIKRKIGTDKIKQIIFDNKVKKGQKRPSYER
jgi:hypothetical protein